MAKQVLRLEPESELHFKGPFSDVVTSHLKLSNPTERRICFKVKTTAPKRYCVRPNSGILEPKQDIEVAVMLQPFEYDPTEKNKHKFMVQTVFAPDEDFNQETVWRDASPESLMDSKLRCVFELPSTHDALLSPKKTVERPISMEASPLHDETDKSYATPLKTLPQPIPRSPGTGSVDVELKKAKEESMRLLEELSSLRVENNHLREEGLRLRMLQHQPVSDLMADEKKCGEENVRRGSVMQFQCAKGGSNGAGSTMMLPVVALMMFFVGVLVSKFFF